MTSADPGAGATAGTDFLAAYPADLGDWEHDSRMVCRGFVHPWQSQVAAGNGESFFDAVLRSQLRPGSVVLDVGCGHGGYASALAESCARVVGIDRDPDVIDFARTLATERQIGNVDFHVLPLTADENETATVGLADASVDLFCCRRGPVLAKWLPLALRLAAPGAVAVGMHPTGIAGAVPPWNHELPGPLRIDRVCDYPEVRSWLTAGLDLAPPWVRLTGCWWLDVPESFDDPEQLHTKLAGHPVRVPYAAVKDALTRLFDAYDGVLELRHCRLVWRLAIA